MARCGTLTGDSVPFLLNVELKEKSRPTLDTLEALLGRYSELFTANGGQAPAVEVVLVGWSPPEIVDRSPLPLGRQVLLTRPGVVEAIDPTVRLISLDFGKTIGQRWLTRGRERRWWATLRATRAAYPSRRLRVFDVPVNEEIYRDLLAAGVDLIGAKQITEAATALTSATR